MIIQARRFFVFPLLFLCSLTTTPVFAATADHWVGTWAASPMAAKNPTAKFGAPGTDGTTLREIVHISLGGPSVRAIFTNEFGLDPLTIDAAQIALSTAASAITPTSALPLTFNGRPSITIPPGALVVSDPVQAGVMAVMAVADTAKFTIARLHRRVF